MGQSPARRYLQYDIRLVQNHVLNMLKRTIPWPGMSYSVSFLTWESDVLSVHLNLCSCVWHVLVIFTNLFFIINIVLLSKMSHKSLITYENYVISRQKVGNFGNLFTYTLRVSYFPETINNTISSKS